MFRNPFDSWTNSLPKPKKFGMPNQVPSPQNQIFSQPDMHPWRNTFFDDTAGPEASPQTPEPPRNEWSDYLREMRDIYTKQGPAATAYGEHLHNLPQYEKPGKMHRFGSALVGAATGFQQGAGAGWQAGQEALNLPYRRAMDEWGTKEQALGRQSEIEDKSTGRRLAFMKEARDVAQNELEWKKIMRDYENKDRQFEADEKYRNAQIQNWRDQGYRETTDAAGNTIFVNPRSGEKFNAGQSSKVTDWKYTDAAQEDARRRTNIQGGQLNVARGQLALGERSAARLERGETPPITAIEQSTARESALTRAAAENEKWSEYFTSDGGLQPRPSDPQEAQQYDRFMNRVMELEQGIFGTRRPAPVYDYIRR